jgi:hypothetical protein
MPDNTDDNFENDCLQTHNNYRKIHSVPDLSIDQKVSRILIPNFWKIAINSIIIWNIELVNYAKSRCQSQSQQEGLSAGHSGLADGIGENLFWGGNSQSVTNTCGQAVKAWYFYRLQLFDR